MDEASTSPEALRLGFLTDDILAQTLFGEQMSTAFIGSPQRTHLHTAFDDLVRNQLVTKKRSGQMYTIAVTPLGRTLSKDMRPLWKEIFAAKLRPEAERLLQLVNHLSQKTEPTMVWVEGVEHELLLQHGWEDKENRLQAIRELEHYGFVYSYPPMGSDLDLTATYKGIVWETRRTPEKTAEPEIAHVLFTDIVGYSKLSMDMQTRLRALLKEVVRGSDTYDNAQSRERVISRSTGDGLALIFFGHPAAPVNCAIEISRALRNYPELGLRMGIHTGPVHRDEDINDEMDVAGGGINYAQRVMDAGDAGHILLSKAVADNLEQMGGWSQYLHDLGEVIVKHGTHVYVFNLYGDDFGNSDRPERFNSVPIVAQEKERKLEPNMNAPYRSTDELTKEYLENLAGRVSKIYIFGEDEPRALDKVFVELSIIEEYQRPTMHAEFLGMMDAEMRQQRRAFVRAYDKSAPRASDVEDKVKRTVKPDDLLRGRTKAVVTGAPGCGKTTLLRYLAWRTHEAHKRLPVFLELKTVTEDAFSRAQHDLAELLFAEAMARLLDLHGVERERLREFFLARLTAGEVAIFLDGLDEVAGTDFFHRLCEAVGEFVRRTHRDNMLVISTRPYALLARLEGLKQMEIAPLNQRQVEEFFAHYYDNDPEAQSLLRTLRQRRPLRELLRVPFLLSVVTQLYRQQHQVVEDRLELYRQLVWQLVVQLDREKRLDRRDFRVPDRTGALKLDFLKYLACERLLIDDVRAEGREAARLVFTGDVILDKAKLFWRSAEHTAGSAYDLAADVKATPLLREVGTDVYAFTHLTIQEYLAAVELSRHADCEQIFCRAYFNSTLAAMEVLPMTLGLVRRPEKFYDALEQLPESLTFTNLRLRARGLAYVPNPDKQLLTRLTNRLLDFVNERNDEEIPYKEIVLRSFSEAKAQSLQPGFEHLTALLQNGDKDERQSAVITLGKIGGEYAVDAILNALLKDVDSGVRQRAAFALGQIGGEGAVDVLIRLLKDADRDVSGQAAIALGYIGGKRAVDGLLPMLKNADSSVRRGAAFALGEMGSEMGSEIPADSLLPLLKDADSGVRQWAAEALGYIGGKRAVTALRPLLWDENSSVRSRAAEALGEIGGKHAVDALLNALLYALLKDEPYVRGWVAIALGMIGSEQAVGVLIPLLRDKDDKVCQYAARALGEIGGERAINALHDALYDMRLFNGNNEIHLDIAIALSKIGSESAVDKMLIGWLTRKDNIVRTYNDARSKAAQALGRIGGERAVDALLNALLKEESSYVRKAEAKALGKIGGERAVDVLIPLLKDKDHDVCQSAAEALSEIDDSELAVGLVRALSHESDFVRRKAAQVVGYYAEGEQVLHELARLASGDSSEAVRSAASEARSKYEHKLAYFR
jgi:HEAT repeat protein/class 3 adenylate cyclase